MPPISIIGTRVALVVGGIVLWYLSQRLIASRVPKVSYERPLTDGLHVLTRRLHYRYFTNERAGNRLLVASSLVIDLLGAYLLISAILGATVRPYLGLVMLFALRQVCQLLCPLPAPSGMVWRYPGVPSVLVTYGTANDLFFSGHTAIAVFGAAMLGELGPGYLALGVAVAVFEAVTVIILRAHYTMDVFTGIITALYIHHLSGQWAPYVDAWIGRVVG